MGGTVVLVVPQPLLPVLSRLPGVDKAVERSYSAVAALVDSDWFVPLMSLPHIFRTAPDSIPSQTPYLSTPSGYRDKWRTLLKPYLKRPGVRNIGLVYASANDMRIKTCPLEKWAPLLDVPGLQWFSVQKGDAAAAVHQVAAKQANLIDLTRHIEDFGDTAALLDQLDLLISIDTSVPHLAGALGKPVWLLLPYFSDWRWMLKRSDSPWYSSFRLFRQYQPGQWEPVIAQIRQALTAWR